MTLTELRYIIAVAREKHFGRAANACHVSQPTLSVAIRKLENELGVSLFERDPGDVRLTPVGEKIVEQAQRVLEDIESIKHLAVSGQDQLGTVLRIGAIYTIAPYLLPPLMPQLQKRAPNMPLHIDENYTSVLTEKLKQGELDAIIISCPFAEPGIITQPLYDEPFVVAMPAQHEWTHKKTIKAEKLTESTMLLLGPGNCFRDQVLEVCPGLTRKSNFGSDSQQMLIGSSLETIRHMVATGAGVTVLPCTSINLGSPDHKLLAIRPFSKPVPKRRVALAWRKRFPRAQAIRVLRQAIQATPLKCIERCD
ncbi:MAG: LysR substrate-binding domain-containing protein [Gammaproteobacteria bacterium]|nr:MAG: LysR substrate-binding domain-containing protein [Gammaproteobacteria bacterium]